MRTTLLTLALLCATATISAQSQRETKLLDSGWRFAFGHAADPQKDFGYGTEYFNFLTKAHSIHNEGPYSNKFDDSSWQPVRLPHDWATELPYAQEASHSHGYHTVGWKYPATSVGWYRKQFTMPIADKGRHVALTFEGIFRNSEVWVNGFYLGREASGYASRTYDVTDYLHYGDEADNQNIITVRADASLEEGWFYEGAGIYRDVWMTVSAPLHVASNGTYVRVAPPAGSNDISTRATVVADVTIENSQSVSAQCTVRQVLLDADGREVASSKPAALSLMPRATATATQEIMVERPHLWSLDDPYLYSLVTEVSQHGEIIDRYTTTTGIRTIQFDKDKGFFLNGRHVKLKGVNLHQDHAGVGSAMPPALLDYRIDRLKTMGVNAYRTSHNPIAPAMLDACDRKGILVIEENRLMGINDYHRDQLRMMIERDRNHPCIIMWSVGNEEWGIEWNDYGERLSQTMTDYVHLLDATRPSTVATSSGPNVVRTVDVAGYNYVVQNDIEGERQRYPDRIAYGSEETTACGTRGIYYDDRDNGHMASMNRTDSTYENIIERGWKFYDERPWLLGCFYWTGFDYKGEPNPLSYPAVDSEFGILDYCGFEKDEAYYLRSWWTDEPVLHIFPHWNLEGHEGEPVEVWAYSNCDEVELWVNGKSMGRQKMEKNGHLKWNTIYKPGTLKAVGYKGGKKLLTEIVSTTGAPAQLRLTADRNIIRADGRDVSVVRIEALDKKGRTVPTACIDVTLSLDGGGRILGVGNGNPAWHGNQHPAADSPNTITLPTFNGLAQVIVQSDGTAAPITLRCTTEEVPLSTISITPLPETQNR